MPLYAFLLVILAALIHATWNFTTKKTSGNFGVLYLGLLFSCFAFLPLLFFLPVSEILNSKAYPYFFATGTIHAIYFFALAKAYEHGDISVVYPIARGSGIAGTAVAAALFLHENLTFPGVVGISAIVAGTILIGFKKAKQKDHSKELFFAFVVGAAITGYSITDKLGVGTINPLAYIVGLALVTTAVLTPYAIHKKRKEISEAWKKSKKESCIIGIGSLGTYIIILFVYKIVQVSYVVALRELAVAFGTLFGFIFLKEQFTRSKIIGIICIVSGMIIIKII
ncbi:MAG: SMR family transporter [Spirochaetota bacterium]